MPVPVNKQGQIEFAETRTVFDDVVENGLQVVHIIVICAIIFLNTVCLNCHFQRSDRCQSVVRNQSWKMKKQGLALDAYAVG